MRTASGEVRELGEGAGQLPLGVDTDVDYTAFTAQLGPGDSIALFTDGVTEAMNPGNDLYGTERLGAAITQANGGVETVGKQILNDVRLFVGPRKQNDDICLVCFGRTP